jgi:hypothetical protein
MEDDIDGEIEPELFILEDVDDVPHDRPTGSG